MQRLKGIGVSPGVVAGRAVLLIQRAHVLRYQIAPSRLEHELQRLGESRVRTREQLIDIQARLAERRPELASLFDQFTRQIVNAKPDPTVTEPKTQRSAFLGIF